MKTTTLIFALLFTCALFAQEFTVDGIKYRTSSINPYTAEATDYTGSSTMVEIPFIVYNVFSVSHIVKTIGNDAFKDNSLTSVTIPDGITTIGDYAFANNSLTSVTIPDNVTTIGEDAFHDNDLTSVTIPDSVTSIGDNAFAENELTTVISESLDPATLISNVFDNRSAIDLSIPTGTMEAYETAGWTGFNSISLFDKKFTIDGIEYTITSYIAPYTVEVSDYTGSSTTVNIPNTVDNNDITYTVTTIGAFAFWDNDLTSITIPDSVTSIGDNAFAENDLTSVTIPDSVTSIGFAAFANNDLTSVISESLNPATLPSNVFDDRSLIDLIIPRGTTEVYETAGWTGFNLVTEQLFEDFVINIDDIEYTVLAETPSYTVKVSDYVGTSPIVVIPNTVTYGNIAWTVTTIGDDAFRNKSLTSVTIPDTVISIGELAFYFNALTTVVSQSLDPATLGDFVFDDHSLIDLSIPRGTTEIYEAAGWTGFNSISLFDKEFTVDGIAYTITDLTDPYTVKVSDYTGSSTTVNIPTTVTNNGFTFTVTTIGEVAFLTDGLTSVIIPNSVTSIEEGAFLANDLTSVTIPDSVTSIGDYVFSDNDLTTVTIPDNVTTIGDYAFADNELTTVISESLDPATLADNVFDDRSLIDLSIPTGTTEAYEMAGWTGFNSISLFNKKFTIDGIEYTITSYIAPYTVEVSGYTGSSPTVNIPTTVANNGFTFAVTAVGTGAFFNKSLSSVTIPDSVITIGDAAFFQNSLTSVAIPDSVTSIGKRAFSENGLTGVAIGNSVISIGDNAFQRNDLTSVTIPESLTSIGSQAFANNLLTSVTIPDNITSIGEAAFQSNDLTSVTIPESLTSIGYKAFANNLLTSVTIPNSVTTIGDNAFAENDLTSVAIPDSVISIGNYAFYQNSLTSVTIPDSVTSIGNYAFNFNSVTNLTIGNSVTTIGEDAFSNNNLTNITIPGSVTSIGNNAFAENELTSITIPSSVTSIGDNAFADNDLTTVISESLDPAILADDVFDDRSLIDLSIPTGTAEVYETAGWTGFNSVTEQAIEDFVIDGITYTVTAATLPYTVKVLDYIGSSATVNIPTTVANNGFTFAVTSIGESAFFNKSLTSVTIPESVINIGDAAFQRNSLASVTIPNGVTAIGNTAFAENPLTSATIGNSVASIGNYAFAGNDLATVTIPNSVTSIGDYAFYQNSLTSVIISTSVTTIGDGAFSDNNLASITIPSSVTTIGGSAFCSNELTSVIIPGSVTTIGDFAFCGNELTTVISESLDPATLLSNVFDDRSLINLTIPIGTTEAYEIAGWTGFNAVSLFDEEFTVDGIVYTITSLIDPYTVKVSDYTGSSTTVNIPATVTNNDFTFAVTTIGEVAFLIDGLTSVTIPNSVTSIEEGAFVANELTSVTIPDSVTSIGDNAFAQNDLTSVISESLDPATLADTVFDDRSLIDLSIPAGTTEAYEMAGWTGFNSVTEQAIEDFVIDGIAYTVTAATPPYTVKASDYTGSSTTVNIPATVANNGFTFAVTSIGDFAFWNNSLTSVSIPDSVTSIGVDAFWSNSLTSVSIPDSVTTIGGYAFAGNDLATVTIGNSVTTIGNYAFDLNELTNVIIPDSVTSIGDAAFRYNDLTSVTIGNSVTTIGDAAFRYNELTSVIIPSSVTTIDDYALAQNNLTSVISESLDPAILLSTVFNNRSAIDLSIPTGTTEAYITKGWTGFNSVTENATLNVTENVLLENLTFTTNANTIIITTTNGVRLKNISLYNMSGQRVIVSQQMEISISHLASSVYIANLTTNLGTVVKKFAK